MSGNPHLATLANGLAREMGLRADIVDAALRALLPAIIGGFKRAMLSYPSDQDEFIPMLIRICGAQLLRDDRTDPDLAASKGTLILAEIFAFEEVNLAVATSASRSSGLEPKFLQIMLPILAVLAARMVIRLHTPLEIERIDRPVRRFTSAARMHPARAAPDLFTLFGIDETGDPLGDMIRNSNLCSA